MFLLLLLLLSDFRASYPTVPRETSLLVHPPPGGPLFHNAFVAGHFTRYLLAYGVASLGSCAHIGPIDLARVTGYVANLQGDCNYERHSEYDCWSICLWTGKTICHAELGEEKMIYLLNDGFWRMLRAKAICYFPSNCIWCFSVVPPSALQLSHIGLEYFLQTPLSLSPPPPLTLFILLPLALPLSLFLPWAKKYIVSYQTG